MAHVHRPVLWLTALSVGTGLVAPGPAQAAEVLEEIVVTAQKREQSAQDVPISISVFGGETLQERNIINLEEMTRSLPGLQVSGGGASDLLYIRGVGSGGNASFEQSVGTFVDGVFRGRSRLSRGSFMDLERIEVLRGPQSTFFGNNAIAGAFSLTSRRPGTEFEARTQAYYEPSDQEYDVEAAIGGPLSDTLGVRVAGRLYGLDGWIEDTAIGQSVPNTDEQNARVTFALTPSESFAALLKLEYGAMEEKGSFPLQLYKCPPPAPFTVQGFCGAALASGAEGRIDDRRQESPGQLNELKNREAVLTLNYSTDAFTLTSLTAYSAYDWELRLDIDVTPLPLFNVFSEEEFHQISQEFRIASNGDGPLSYLAGIYVHDSELDWNQQFSYLFLTPVIQGIPPLSPLVASGPFGQRTGFVQDEQTRSAFGALTWSVTDSTRVTGGLRWTDVEKDFTQTIVFGNSAEFGGVVPYPPGLAALAQAFANGPGLGVAGTIALDRTDSRFVPSLTVEHDLSDRVMLYAKYSDGFKAGGFDGQNQNGVASQLPFEPESVDAFELGIKGRWLGGALESNVALFHSKYTDLQQSVPAIQGAAVIFVVSNVGGSTSRGLEADLTWAATERLRLYAAATLLDSTYDDYPAGACTARQTLAGCTGQNLTGERTLYAPRFSGVLDGTYRWPLSGTLELVLGGAVYGSSSYYTIASNDPDTEQGSYTRIDARIALAGADERWQVAVVGRNLTDEKIITFSSGQPTALGSHVVLIDRLRTIGLQAQYRW